MNNQKLHDIYRCTEFLNKLCDRDWDSEATDLPNLPLQLLELILTPDHDCIFSENVYILWADYMQSNKDLKNIIFNLSGPSSAPIITLKIQFFLNGKFS